MLKLFCKYRGFTKLKLKSKVSLGILITKTWRFHLQVYTDQQHGLSGGNTKKHLYESMEDFLGECFEGVSKKFEMKQKEHDKPQKQEPVEWQSH